MSSPRLYTTHIEWWHVVRLHIHMITNHWLLKYETYHDITCHRRYKFGVSLSCDYCGKTLFTLKQRRKQDAYITPR